MATIGWGYGIMGVVIALLAIPLYFEKIPPNGLYGFRIPKTIENPKLWYLVNKYSARWLFAAGLLTSLAAAGFYQIPGFSLDVYAFACLGVFLAVFVTGVVFTLRYMKNEEREV